MSIKQIISEITKGALGQSAGKQQQTRTNPKSDMKIIFGKVKKDIGETWGRIIKNITDELVGLLTRLENYIDECDPT